jgi:hypothetical protein
MNCRWGFYLLLLLAFLPESYAHMRMNEPPPILSPEESALFSTTQDYPLHPDGSDFPCQNMHRYPGHVPVKNWTVGEYVPIR